LKLTEKSLLMLALFYFFDFAACAG